MLKQIPRRPPDFVRGNHFFWWRELVYSGRGEFVPLLDEGASGYGLHIVEGELHWKGKSGRYVGVPGAQGSYLKFIANEVLRED